MATLHTLFYSRRAALQRELDAAETPRDLTERLHHALDELQKDFLDDVSPDQARLAIAMIESIRLSTAALATGVVSSKSPRQLRGSKGRPSRVVLLALQLATGIGLAISLAVMLPWTWLPL